MAHTRNGNYIGAAAHLDRVDRQQAILDDQEKEIKRKNELIYNLMLDCRDIGGEEFVYWWDEVLPTSIPLDKQIQYLKEYKGNRMDGIFYLKRNIGLIDHPTAVKGTPVKKIEEESNEYIYKVQTDDGRKFFVYQIDLSVTEIKQES